MAVALAFPLALPLAAPVHAQTQDATLRTVTVPAQRDSYLQPDASIATRDALPLEQVPQSVIVVTRKLIEDQGAQTMSDALRNVSNVRTVDQRDMYNIQFKVRGFSAATVVDGQAMPSTFSNLESTVSVERIEVLKGPAPALNSGGQSAGGIGFVGGAIAVTTKSPEAAARRDIALRLGSRAEQGLTFDLNQPVNDAVGFRIVGEIQHNGSETNGVYFRRGALFPSLSVRPSADSELLVKLRVSRQTTLDYSGLPPEGSLLPAAYAVPRSLNITANGQPPSTNAVDGINLQWKQAINSAWSYDVRFAQNNARLDQNGVFTDDFFAPNPGPIYLLTGLNLTQKTKSTTLSSTLKGKVDALGVKHKLAFGIDLDRTTDFGYMAAGGGYFGLGAYDISAPTVPNWIAPVPNLPGAQDNRYRSTALFAQDHVTIGSNLHLLAALRHTSIKVDNQWPDFFVSSVTSHSKSSPRVGAVYAFGPQVSAFAGYGEGMTIPTNGIYTTPPKPEGSKQTELGVRFKDLAGVNATIALFDLSRTNVAVADPLNFGQSIQVGEQRSNGIDIDAVWRANRSLTWLGHYTHQNPRVTKDTTLAVGNQLFNVPKTSMRIAARYDFLDGALRGVGAGLGATHHSALPDNSANTLFTPAVTVWDAQLSYVVDAARYALTINNLLDRKYYEPSAYFAGNHVTPATRRQLSLTAGYTF